MTHQEEIVSLAVGSLDRYAYSLGGEVDSKVTVWDRLCKKPVCSKFLLS